MEFVSQLEKREMKLNQLQDEIQRKIQKLEEERHRLAAIAKPSMNTPAPLLPSPSSSSSSLSLFARTNSFVPPNSPPRSSSPILSPTHKDRSITHLRNRIAEIQETLASPIASNDLFIRVLADPDTRRAFKLFSAFDFNEEAFLFFDHSEKYRNSSPERLRSLALRIYKRFVCDAAPQKVSLPPEIEQAIHVEMSRESFCADKNLFDAANSYVYSLLKRHSLPRFLLSDFSADFRTLALSLTHAQTSSSLPLSPSLPSLAGGQVPLSLGHDGKFAEQKYMCHVDRSIRRWFLASVRERDFDSAMESFEMMIHSGMVSPSSAYYRPAFLLQSIANAKQRDVLRCLLAKEGMSLETAELVMTAFAEEGKGREEERERDEREREREREKWRGGEEGAEKKLHLRNLEERAPHTSAIVTPRSRDRESSRPTLPHSYSKDVLTASPRLVHNSSKESITPRLIHTTSKESLTRGSRRLSGHTASLTSINIGRRLASPSPSPSPSSTSTPSLVSFSSVTSLSSVSCSSSQSSSLSGSPAN